MNKTAVALAAIAALSFAAPAQAVIINYTVSGSAIGTFALDLNAGVYSLSAADILAGGNHFTSANTSLVSFAPSYYIGGTLNGANGITSGTDDFLIRFLPALKSQNASIAVTNIGQPPMHVPDVLITQLAGTVPEPSTWAMMLLGFGGIGMAVRRSMRQVGARAAIA